MEPRLVIHFADGTEQTVDLRQGRLHVGRAPDAGLRLAVPEVSGHHAELHWDGTQLAMRDLSSTNGTEVNGRRLTEWTTLRDGDRIRWGPVTADVVLARPAPAAAPAPAWSWGQTARMPSPPSGLPQPQSPARPPRPEPTPLVPAQREPAQREPAQREPAQREPASQEPVQPEPAPGRRPSAKRIFISHASEDKRRARMVAGILRRQGWQPWIDESDIPGGSSWAASIQQALKASSVVVLLITSRSVAKEWVMDEIVAARNLRVPIIPAVLEDVRLPDELRFMLQRTQFVNIEALTSHDSDYQQKRQQAAHRLDSAILGVLERQGRLNPDRARMRIGRVLEWIGVLLLLGGFAGFIYMGFRQSNPEASPVPVIVPWVVFVIGMFVAAAGAAMVRSGRAKGL